MEVLYNRKDDQYWCEEKYNGQKYVMCFEGDDNATGDVAYFNVSMNVVNKRKTVWEENEVPTSTGKNIMHTYGFAKRAFESLMAEIEREELPDYKKVIVEVHWLDNRRCNVYEKFLKKYGFSYGVSVDNGKKCLHKILYREKSND